MGCLNQPVMVYILVDGHIGIGRKQLVDVVGMVIQVGGDLLVADVGSVILMNKGKNTCNLGICSLRCNNSGAQDFAEDGLEYAGAVGLTVILMALHFPQNDVHIRQNGGSIGNVDLMIQRGEVRKGDLLQGGAVSFTFALQLQGVGDVREVLGIVKIKR